MAHIPRVSLFANYRTEPASFSGGNHPRTRNKSASPRASGASQSPIPTPPRTAFDDANVFYTPDEFLALLVAAKDELADLRPIVAIGGFSGLRTAEMLRLDWADIWRVPDHIEVSAGKSKTRQRRLVETCPALKKWLEPHLAKKAGPLWNGHEVTFQQKFVELCEIAKLNKKSIERKSNGLRHAFCTYHYAFHANENLTSQQAGNSPAMIHQHYKGLATKAEGEKWFAVIPGGGTQ